MGLRVGNFWLQLLFSFMMCCSSVYFDFELWSSLFDDPFTWFGVVGESELSFFLVVILLPLVSSGFSTDFVAVVVDAISFFRSSILCLFSSILSRSRSLIFCWIPVV